MVPRRLSKKYLETLRFYRRKRVREQLRKARHVLAVVNARKATVVAVVGGALLCLLSLGGVVGAVLAHHWWLR